MFKYNESLCVICRTEFDDSRKGNTKVLVSDKRTNSLLEYSEFHIDGELTQYLSGRPNHVYVRSNCHKKYTNKKFCESRKRRAPTDQSNVAPKVTGSAAAVRFD